MATSSAGEFQQPDDVETLPVTPRPLPTDSDLIREVTAIFSRHLKGTDVAVDDDFFGLGGNSMIGIKIIDRILQDYGVELSVRAFYLAQTPAKVAELVEMGRAQE